MNISIGLLDFREEKRIQEKIYAAAFQIGYLYPNDTFNDKTPVDFLKSEILERVQDSEKVLEDITYKQKMKKAQERIKETVAKNPTMKKEDLEAKASAAIKRDLANKKLLLKQKLYTDALNKKIIKAANIGSAFSAERKSVKRTDKNFADVNSIFNKKIIAFSSINIMPHVIADKSKDLVKQIKNAYNKMLTSYASTHQQTVGVIDLLKENSILLKEDQVSSIASEHFAKQNNPEIFNELLKKHKQEELAPEFISTTNKFKVKM